MKQIDEEVRKIRELDHKRSHRRLPSRREKA